MLDAGKGETLQIDNMTQLLKKFNLMNRRWFTRTYAQLIQ